jgi:hypothetical protein
MIERGEDGALLQALIDASHFDSDSLVATFLRGIPLGRLARAEDVAAALFPGLGRREHDYGRAVRGDGCVRSYPYVGRWGHPGGESSQSCCRPYGVVSRRLYASVSPSVPRA